MRTQLPKGVLTLVLLAAALGAPGAHAQGPALPGRAQGWIGLALEVREAWRGGRQPSPSPGSPVLVVSGVHPGGPAARAGISAGDTLLSVGGRDASPAVLARLQSTLQPGQRVSFTFRVGARPRTVLVQAAVRPGDEVLATLSPQWRGRLDSAQALFLRQLELTRFAPPAAPWSAVGWPEGPPPGPSLRDVLALGIAFPDPAFAPPFPSLLVRHRQLETLGRRLEALQREMHAARAAEASRLRGLVKSRQTTGRGEPDAELRRLRERQQEILREAASVKEELERVAWSALEGLKGLPVAGTLPAEEPRPLSPYIVGRDWIAGARLTPVSPQLGAYFGVGRGLLVVEIAEGTPASQAGLLPGDVILAAGAREVLTVEELRAALSTASTGPVTVGVMRRGAALRLTLPR